MSVVSQVTDRPRAAPTVAGAIGRAPPYLFGCGVKRR